MLEDDLLEAMRLGSRSPLADREPRDLGRFGLGLKTASFSQCRRLTVVSRASQETAIARWDLDHVGTTGKWEVQLLDDQTTIPWINDLREKGTLIIWQKLRFGSNNPEPSSKDVEDFSWQLDEALNHLELVFHRFLSGETGSRKINITLNNRPLVPFDPFHSRHPATVVGPKENIRVDRQNVEVQPFSLPHHSKVTSAEWDHYGGKAGYLRNQGFYLYRGRRLIVHGTWFGLAPQTELTKLARVRIDMPSALDRAWKIDIKKASAQLPPVVRQRLRRIIEPLGAASKRAYRSRGRRRLDGDMIAIWNRIERRGEISYSINHDHPTLIALKSDLTCPQTRNLERVLEFIGTSLPIEALLVDMSRDADRAISSTMSEDTLSHLARITFEHLKSMAGSSAGALAAMKAAEPFRSDWVRIRERLEDPGEEGTDD